MERTALSGGLVISSATRASRGRVRKAPAHLLFEPFLSRLPV